MVAVAAPVETTVSELQRQRKELERRLTLGWQIIDDRIASGRDVRSHEERWIGLLMEYERVCDDLSRLAA